MQETRAHPFAEVRRQRGLTQEALSKMVGVSRSAIASVESRHQRPWPKLRGDISRVLGLPESELFREEE